MHENERDFAQDLRLTALVRSTTGHASVKGCVWHCYMPQLRAI
jgi:hypothetical protein